MRRVALFLAAGLVGLASSASAQISFLPNPFSGFDGTSLRIPSLGLSDHGPFSFPTALETARTPDFLPDLPAAAPGRVTLGSVSGRDVSKDGYDSKTYFEMRKPFFDYVTGEVGAVYGHSSGKFSTDYEAGYLMGTVGNDKMQISAGASYEHWDTNFPHRH